MAQPSDECENYVARLKVQSLSENIHLLLKNVPPLATPPIQAGGTHFAPICAPAPYTNKNFLGPPNPQGPKFFGSKFFFAPPPLKIGETSLHYFRKMFRPHAPYKCAKFQEIILSIHGDILTFIC